MVYFEVPKETGAVEMIPLKKDKLSNSSASDIELLFSRAGMAGAKYRKFARVDLAQAAGNLQETPGPDEVSPTPAAAALPAFIVPLSVSARPTNTSADSSQAADFPRYSSLERIFADSPIEPESGDSVHGGVKVAIASLAGGVGKTTLAATLARIFSEGGRRVLVADCGIFPAIPQHFGSRAPRVGTLQFLYAPAGVAAQPVGMFRVRPDEFRERKVQDILDQVESSESLLFIDLPTIQSPAASDVLSMVDHILVPLTPDVHSIGDLARWRSLLADQAASGAAPQVHYLLNRFDTARPLHHAISARLRETLGDSLLPFTVHEDAAIEEAAASGVTIMDYRPDSTAARELAAVAEWLTQICGSHTAVRTGGAA